MPMQSKVKARKKAIATFESKTHFLFFLFGFSLFSLAEERRRKGKSISSLSPWILGRDTRQPARGPPASPPEAAVSLNDLCWFQDLSYFSNWGSKTHSLTHSVEEAVSRLSRFPIPSPPNAV